MPINILDKYSDTFVETGTFVGDGIQTALNCGYKNVISIELFDKWYDFSTNRFKYNKNVNIVKGDSALILGDVIRNIDEKITFWLDGHFSGEGTGFGVKEFPLMEELNFIKQHKCKNHVILIDDVPCWNKPDTELTVDNVISTILNINSKYEFFYLDWTDYYNNRTVEDYILVAKVD